MGVFITKGTTINDLGVGPEEIEKKNFLKVHVWEKNKFQRPSSGRNNLPRKK